MENKMAKYASNGYINLGQIPCDKAMILWTALNSVHCFHPNALPKQLEMLRELRAKLIAGGIPKEDVDEHDDILAMYWDMHKSKFIEMENPVTKKDFYAVRCKHRDEVLANMGDDNE